MTSLHGIYGLPPQLSKSWLWLYIKPCSICIPDTGRCIFGLLRAPSQMVAYNIAKMQKIRWIASSLKVLWYGMEYGRKFLYGMEDFYNGMEENCQCAILTNHLPFPTMP